MALLSMMALYHWDDHIFSKLILPDGMDREALIAEILTQTAELEVVYPDWDIMRDAIGYWSRTMIKNWWRAWEALQLEYNPLWNVDANIREAETRDLANTERRSASGSSRDDGSGNQTEKTDGNVTMQVSAFNDANTQWANRQKDTTDATVGTTYKDARSRTYNDGEQRNGTDTGSIIRDTRRTGNIGVTSSQQLINEELDLAERNLYHDIVRSFKQRFCLMVY